MVKFLLFLMCFAIFHDLNTFLEEVGKLFVGTGEGMTCPSKCHLLGQVTPSPAPKNDSFLGAGEGVTRSYKCIFTDGSVATINEHHLLKQVKFWFISKKS